MIDVLISSSDIIRNFTELGHKVRITPTIRLPELA